MNGFYSLCRCFAVAKRNQITIRTSVLKDDQVEIAIADNGLGMPETIQQRVFNPFFTTKPTGKGTGMGMSISYQIIPEKHGGLLKCSSSPGLVPNLLCKFLCGNRYAIPV